jgi:glycosyltransferase involved in cell wall biosynthesis
VVLAEYYPRARDPVRGIWAHRQALAAHDAGAEVRVLVLHRPLPPLESLRDRDAEAALRELRQPPHAQLDGLRVDYVRYISPPRAQSYKKWGAWAAPLLKRRLISLARDWPFDLIHAHYALPAGDAARRAAPRVPLVVSVHGHDVFGPGSGGERVTKVLAGASLVLANSAGTAERCSAAGARATRVVHLGSDLPPAVASPPASPTLVTVAHLAARKRHADVLDAVAIVRASRPEIRYVIVGDGPEREAIRARIATLGLERHVELRGALPNPQAVAAARSATLCVMPSVDEAFGVAYVEAMAGGVPAIGCAGEPGPEEIARAGSGIELVPAREPAALAEAIERLLSDPAAMDRLRIAARETVRRDFTWERCGQETVDSYHQVLHEC